MWPDRRLTDLLGIEHPIIQAPMAGSSTPELAAAVSNAGGLGSLGCATQPLEKTRTYVTALREGTNRPFNLNFFAHPEPVQDPEREATARVRTAAFFDELNIGQPRDLAVPFTGFDREKLALVLDLGPQIVSFHFGLPGVDAMAAIRDHGIRILCSATTVSEARSLEAGGVDAVIAQGWEAGGHRGAFEIEDRDAGIGTMALVPQIVDAVSVPVIAAGGIADARGIAAAFALGASGVQMGTAFLACPETSIPDAHRQYLANAADTDTRLTLGHSGRPVRVRQNRYTNEIAGETGPLPQFPLMYNFSTPLRDAEGGKTGDFLNFLYGQAAALSRPVPAAELMETLIEDTLRRLHSLANNQGQGGTA